MVPGVRLAVPGVRVVPGVRLGRAVPGVRMVPGVGLTVAERVLAAGGAVRRACSVRADLVPVAGALFGPRDIPVAVLGGKGGFLAGGLLVF